MYEVPTVTIFYMYLSSLGLVTTLLIFGCLRQASLLLCSIHRSRARRGGHLNHHEETSRQWLWHSGGWNTGMCTLNALLKSYITSCEHLAVFPQLKNKFPGMNSEISRNSSQCPETEEEDSVLVRCPQKFKICTICTT